MTKIKMIERHLRDGNKITQAEANILYGTSRLAAIIHRLRERGMDIETEDYHTRDRFGNKVTVGRYYINYGEK